MHAFLQLSLYFHPLLHIGDVRITHADARAAELFGVETPHNLVGRFMSDFQPEAWRDVGRLRWGLRQLGHYIPGDYVTVIRRADGELVGQWRELASSGIGVEGEHSYVMRCAPVREVDHLPVVSLEDYGVNSQQIEPYIGRYTVANIRQQLGSNTFCLHGAELFSTIVNECNDLVKTKLLGRYPSGLDLALSPAVQWSLKPYASSKTLVRICYTCNRCGWSWRSPRRQRGQCPACRYRYTR